MNDAETTSTANTSEQGAAVAPAKARSKKDATPKKDAPTGQKRAKGAKAKATAPQPKTATKTKGVAKAAKKESPAKTSSPRAESKGAKLLAMIGRAKGATLAELMTELSWQAHSIRGFISTAGKKHSITIESSKNDAGERVYKIIK